MPRFDNAIAIARELGVSLKVLASAMRLDVEGVPDDSTTERFPDGEASRSQPKDNL